MSPLVPSERSEPRFKEPGPDERQRLTSTSPIPQVTAKKGSPADAYQQRLSRRRATCDAKVRLGRRIADARLGVFVVGLVLVFLSLVSQKIAWWWILLPMAGFLALIVVHERTKKTTRRASRAAEFYELGLKRIDGTWPGCGISGSRFLDPEHIYAGDLDLFGVGSLFERLCTARTRSGEETLAGWLLGPAQPKTIAERHAAVCELRPRLDLREDLIMLGTDVQEGIASETLIAWGKEPAEFPTPTLGIIAAILAVLGMLSAVAAALTEFGTIPLFLVIFVDAAFYFRVKSRIIRGVSVLERRTHDLVLLAELLARLEKEPFESANLDRLKHALASEGEPASKRVARLAQLVQVLEAKDNQIFAPFAALLMWGPLVAIAIDRWRVRTGPSIAGWLAAIGEFEAICSLAAYAFENPDDPFPVILESEVAFDGKSVGHPLLPVSTCVTNNVKLGGALRVLLVSGSNMSGKSTLLRTIGTNTVLALAGAPVRAKSLRVSVLSIGSTLRIQDSLQAGKSRFYAEITRVRMIVDLARGTRPLLFLLDEIFHGTNSHDRAVGAGAVVRGLIDLGAIGLVTTHDLALAEEAGTLAPAVANVHFEDQLLDGVMHFDYTMRPGVITHSNALALMRAVGLDV